MGRGVSLAWVTALDTGKPVADATITVSHSCSGRRFGTAKSDRGGLVMIRGLPDPLSASDCESRDEGSAPLLVSARKDGDLSFVLTSWSQGIQPWAFDLSYGWTAPEPIFHTIFDRTLLRAGETVHMTHVYRKPVLRGFQSGGAIRGVLQFAHRGSDIEFDVPVVLDRAGMAAPGRAIAEDPGVAPHLAQRLLSNPGQTVTSTLDARVQTIATVALRHQLLGLGAERARDGAVVVLDNASGDVLAYVGGIGAFSTAAHVDNAAAPRQAGSTLKPFLYGQAIERGYLTAASILDDNPIELDTASGLYVPKDYDHDYKGPVSVRTALAASLNVPAVRALQLDGSRTFAIVSGISAIGG